MAYVPVATLDELAPGTARRVELDGRPVCLVRTTGGDVHALHDVCSHQEYALSEGWVDEGTIECALHGSGFDVTTGAPTSLPAVRPVPVYAVQVSDGVVAVDVGDQRNDAPIPRH
jgi:3-phenylpropionate/trans-cinnamate dioxygenase ferredoxin component